MQNIKLEKMINEFLDGELPKEKENYLFSALGSDVEAREYFKKLNSIKLLHADTSEKFPNELDVKILTKLKNQNSNTFLYKLKNNPFVFLAYAIILFLLGVGYMFSDQYSYQQRQLELSHQQMAKQERLIQLIMNSQLPQVTVESELQDKVIIKATM